jgi:CDP-diacylglycerol--glycerol-3-phosphate 3-phosphatidyltransferase
LARLGVTANEVTVASTGLSLAIGFGVAANADTRELFLLIPVWFPLRMVLNAIDGLLAREFYQRTPLGAYLNELGDVVSDTALYLPFALVKPFSALSVGTVIFFCVASGIRRSARRNCWE